VLPTGGEARRGERERVERGVEQRTASIGLATRRRRNSMKIKRKREDDPQDVVVDDSNPPLTIPQIKTRIKQLLDRIPSKEATASLTPDDLEALEGWCKTVRGVLRNYNLTLNFVAIANYQWEPGKRTPSLEQT